MIEENLALPFVTQVLGQEVTVAKVDITKRDQIVAIFCVRGKVSQIIPILDLQLPDPHPKGAEWIDAYRQLSYLMAPVLAVFWTACVSGAVL